MKKLFQVLVLGFVCMVSFNIVAQQDPHFTQYFDNTLFVNPAYAGSKDVLNLTAIHREQWVGFNGRPRSTTFSVHSPLTYQSVGLGFTLVNDQAGPIRQTMFYGDVSYTLRFKNNRHKLSFGVKGGINLVNIGTTELNTTESNDPNLLQSARNNINPNFGVGIYYHTPKFFVGLSTPKILEASYDGQSASNLEKRHYFGILGGVIKMTDKWKLRPTSQVKITEGAPMSLDLSAAAIYQDKFWIGAMYRLDAAFGAFVQYQITTQFKMGFATDFGTQPIRNYNYGTFEIMASYDFIFKKDGIRSPRYF